MKKELDIIGEDGHLIVGNTAFNLFHHLWTKAVGTENYIKDEWKELERLLLSDRYSTFGKLPVSDRKGSMIKMGNSGGDIYPRQNK